MTAIQSIDLPLLRQLQLPSPAGETDKNTRGRVLVIGGSRGAPGAVVLSGSAALRVGAGKIQLAVPESMAIPVGLVALEAGIYALPENPKEGFLNAAPGDLLSIAKQVDAVLIGPGIMSERSANDLMRCLLSQVIGPKYVIDALALCGLWDEVDLLQAHSGRVVITPHAGEMAQLARIDKAEVEAEPLAVARKVASHLSAIVVLKGATTHVVTPAGLAYRHDEGVIGLATAGSGDVLAGALAGLASRGASPVTAAVWSVFLHGQAGRRLAADIGSLGFIAREIVDQFPGLLDSVQTADASG